MSTHNLESSVIGQLIETVKERGTELPCLQSARPVLYLKCWGPDYPYLQGVELQRRWLPIVVDSIARL